MAPRAYSKIMGFSQAGTGRKIECGGEKCANAYGEKKNIKHAQILFSGEASSKLLSRGYSPPLEWPAAKNYEEGGGQRSKQTPQV
jgi:hypothetical protein